MDRRAHSPMGIDRTDIRRHRRMADVRGRRCGPGEQLEHDCHPGQSDGRENGIVSSRTLAIVQAAIHDALNTIDPRYERYTFAGDAPVGASVDAAIAAAARDAIVGAIASVRAVSRIRNAGTSGAGCVAGGCSICRGIAGIPDGLSKGDGIAVGQAAAAAILALRSTDQATTLVTYTPGTQPGDWQPTPNPVPADPPAPADRLPALLPGWGQVTPFVLRRSTSSSRMVHRACPGRDTPAITTK